MATDRSEAPVDRNCDVVMKGGITSGVVYPKAITRLAEKFRLRNVGGTSAGAIGAAAAAAAQYGERNRGTDPKRGFEGLRKLPKRLETELEPLFQSSPSTEPIFNIVMAATKAEKGFGPKLAAIAPAAAGAFFLWGLLGALPGIAMFVIAILNGGAWWQILSAAAAAVLIAAIGFVVLVVIGLARRFISAVPKNYFGLCTGYRSDERVEPQPLTSWLTNELDALAGTKDREAPLLFRDLWGSGDPKGARDINLQMLTTCLTHGAAYGLPIEEHGRWWFSPKQFADLFPERVVKWMVKSAPPPDREGPFDGLLQLPPAADIPVVVAARMSLSFPVLISAVPLYTVDRSRRDRAVEAYEAREARRAGKPREFNRGDAWRPEVCWFSDGGITSNFPIQFFDSPVPRWPTFGINLRKFGRGWQRDPKDELNNIDMPRRNKDGRTEPWASWGESGAKQLLGFGMAIMDTSRNWMDNAQMRVPGYRDRIVHIGHDEDEGGMNLSMPDYVIERLSSRGERAADELIRRFSIPPQTPYSLTWENQRWLRYRSYMGELGDALNRFRLGCLDPEPGDRTIRQLSDRGEDEPPDEFHWKTDFPQRDSANEITDRLNELAEFWSRSPSLLPGAPRPRPQLRLTPRL